MVKYLILLKNIIYYVAIILLVSISLITAASIFTLPGGYRVFMVETGSMEPSIKTGSVILIKEKQEYTIGDIVTFTANPGQPLKLSTVLVTHRIHSMKDDPQKGTLIILKGDANQTPDPEPIKKEQILGSVIFTVPFLGYPVRFAKSQTGFITLIVVPGTLIIYGELVNIKNEIVKFFASKKKGKKKKKKGTKKESSSNLPITKMLLIPFILTFSSLLYLLPTQAYFNDSSSSKSNVLSVGTWGEISLEIHPGEIVINEVYYDVDSTHGDDGNVSGSDEWIELYNNLDTEVSLQNWTLSDNSNTNTITGDYKIPAKGFAIIAKEDQTWSYWPSIPTSAVKIPLGAIIGGGLANDGDRVILRDSTNTEIDAVSWGTNTYAFTPSVLDALEGHSISRKAKGVDTNSSIDWMDTYSGSTPPGPNPGTNPHNEDGSVVTPPELPTPEPTSPPQESTASAQEEIMPEVTPTPTPLPEADQPLSKDELITPTPSQEITPTPEPQPTETEMEEIPPSAELPSD